MLRSINWPITVGSSLLLAIGISVIYSSSASLAIGQIIFTVVGMMLFLAISHFDYRATINLIKPLYLISILLLILVFIIGFETRGVIRWIPFGIFNIQPSEFVKPILILFLANFWSNNLPSWRNIFKSLLYILLPLFLIFRQPDLGTTLTIITIWLGLLFCAKISIKKMLAIALAALIFVPFGWISLQSYQKDRLISFLSPTKDPLGAGYNVIQSTIAVGSGEILGRGLGRGTQSHLQFLPEFRTDFIFAAIAEEFGFLGSALILLIYFYLIIYCFRVAQTAPDYFGFLICAGVGLIMLFQTIVNVGMNIGLLPITGITLPLISYGGSSLLATFISLGLVASVANYRKTIKV